MSNGPSEQDEDGPTATYYRGQTRRKRFEQHKVIYMISMLAEEINPNV
jgi:hypothetical protein